MRKTLLVILLSLTLALVPAAGVLAATSQDVTVTATPLYLSITNSPNTWTINGLGTGSETTKGKIQPNVTYYANPVDGADDTTPPSATVNATECNFTVSNASGAAICDLTVIWGAFTGGDANMANSDNGSNGATDYGAYCWYEGMTYSNKVLVKTSGSDKMYSDGLSGGNDLDWGVEILTRTDEWTGTNASTSTLTITATAH